MEPRDPMEVAIALALYDFNSTPIARAKRLETTLPAEDVDPRQVAQILETDAISFGTRMHPIVARMYLKHALDDFGEEAQRRVRVNERAEAAS